MLALEALTVLSSSILGFILGVCIGLALGYNIWSVKDE